MSGKLKLNSQKERIAFVPTEEQIVRYRLLRKRLIDEPGLVNISEELRSKLEEILDRWVPRPYFCE